MSLYRKLVLFMLVATVVPFSVVGFALVRRAEDALRTRIRAQQANLVSAEADAVGVFVRERVADLTRATRYFDLAGATPDELEGAVRVLYKVAPDVSVAALLDPTGKPLAPPVNLPDPSKVPGLTNHPAADAAAVTRLLEFVPLDRATAEGPGSVVLSPAYGVPERKETAFAVALPVADKNGTVRIFAAEISLGAIERQVKADTGAGNLVVVDADHKVVAGPDVHTLRKVNDTPEVRRALAATKAGTTREVDFAGPVLAAFAPVPVPGLGWSVVASLPENKAFAEVRRMRLVTVGASGGTIALLLVFGAMFTGRIRRGLGAVREGAVAFKEGNLDHRIDPPSEEELRDLATTFNAMGEELGSARARLERWNDELQAEVDARTRELREAQARLLQTQKLAAVGQLGAGVAHEINNPLAGVLGNIQLLLMKKRKDGAGDDDPEVKALVKVETAAKRCKDVTGALLRFSQQTDAGRQMEVDLNNVVEEVVRMSETGAAEAGVTLETALASPPPMVAGDSAHISQVLLHLVSNAKTAVTGVASPRVRIVTGTVDGAATVSVQDNGKGIDPSIRERIFEPFFTTKDVWTNLGLGLAVAFRIVEDHHGEIAVQSEVGKGTAVTVKLPRA